MKYSFFTRRIVWLVLCLLIASASAAQDTPLAPPEIPGQAVYIPFPVAIALDGDLEDWAGVPTVTVDRGTMPSPLPAENGSFTFAIAADASHLFVYMTMPDMTIVTGQHGTNFWNEDSLEFYLNLSGDLGRTNYGDGVFQININPGDIGSSDPAAVTITGTRGSASGTQAVVFATTDGWGFEAAVPLAPFITLAHGVEIGFQAHANGSSGGDRTVKLIWSLADTADSSYADPSVFGRGLFFEIGQTEIPMPSEVVPVESVVEPYISLNQLGYHPNSIKRAMLAADVAYRPAWSLFSADTGEMVAAGLAERAFTDELSGDTLHIADFSAHTAPGTYLLRIDTVTSAPFVIAEDLYAALPVDALRYFYLNRSGIELTPEFAGDWARGAGHLSDSTVTCYSGTDLDGVTWEGCGYTLDASKGWYDAGDYGKYVVNGGIAVWTLLNLYERNPAQFADGSLRIPESGNGLPDILDEVRWELEFLLGMQVPEGEPLVGMAHHKLHSLQWDGLPLLPPAEVDNSDPAHGRYLMPPTTAATLNLAATAAQCARVWRDLDAAFAERCLTAATRAWNAALANPQQFIGNTPGAGGGNYPDSYVQDEFFWAAAELFITTGEAQYETFLRESPHFSAFGAAGGAAAMTWGDTSALGTISLAVVANALPEADIQALRDQIIRTADFYLAVIAEQGYGVPMGAGGYVWGSNSVVLNNALVLGLAYDFTGERKYLDGVISSMDTILGRNATGYSFVAGYGSKTPQHIHHRFWANDPGVGYPVPAPGALAGGPNADPVDEPGRTTLDQPIPRRYIDHIDSYSTNEVAINWNAPLAWVAAFLAEEISDLR